MNRIIFTTLLTIMCLLGFVSNVRAQDYRGTLSNVTMNGKHFNNVENQLISLSDKGDGSYRLTGEVQKIGKMPGTISLEININIKNGMITPANNESVGTLIVNGMLKIQINLKNISGYIKDNTIHFVLDTYAGWKKTPLFPTSVTFDGTY